MEEKRNDDEEEVEAEEEEEEGREQGRDKGIIRWRGGRRRKGRENIMTAPHVEE